MQGLEPFQGLRAYTGPARGSRRLAGGIGSSSGRGAEQGGEVWGEL